MITRPRKLFADGWYSFWHVVFGFLTVFNTAIAIVFVLYQLYDYKDKNMIIDLTEYFIGFAIALAVSYTSNTTPEILYYSFTEEIEQTPKIL